MDCNKYLSIANESWKKSNNIILLIIKILELTLLTPYYIYCGLKIRKHVKNKGTLLKDDRSMNKYECLCCSDEIDNDNDANVIIIKILFHSVAYVLSFDKSY